MKAQADTIETRLSVKKDCANIERKSHSILQKNMVKIGIFSKSHSGQNSEESRIVKAWHDLIEEAQVIDTKQVIQDFDSLMPEQWPCNIVGCYLSKYLEVPRAALKVFELTTRSVLYTKGNFQKEEDEIIEKHTESNDGKYL